MIDIIIPVYNEEQILVERRDYYRSLKQKANMIFVDGGSSDRTTAIARDFGEVILSPLGRGLQKNRGGEHARCATLLFLHVDTMIEPSIFPYIHQILSEGIVAGCLTMRIDLQSGLYPHFERVVNFRARLFNIVDGDLGLFIKRDVFQMLGGFDPLPVMEDIMFSKKLRLLGRGKFAVLPSPITVSSRKWKNEGFGRTFLRYSTAYMKLWIKTSSDHEQKISPFKSHHRICP